MAQPSSPIDFRTTNTIWCSILAETLSRLGLTTAIICPGSRSTPLTLAFVHHPNIEAIPILDERSAAFFALGIARRSHTAVALVCTSGTAGANFYPAVIEAHESRVPLLILTADRPPELRACNSGQTIDQQKFYGTVPNWYAELALPSLANSMLAYVRQSSIHAWERSHTPVPGPVHLNLPFCDPLAPLPEANALALADTFDSDRFFSHLPTSPTHSLLNAVSETTRFPLPLSATPSSDLVQHWRSMSCGIIIAGVAQPLNPERYCQAIAQLSAALGWPVLAEGLSPVRNYASLNSYLISTYDTILRQPACAAELVPEAVIRIGEMPTSKVLRQWLAQADPQQWVIDEGDRNLDPIHGRTVHVRISIEGVVSRLPLHDKGAMSSYLNRWITVESITRQTLDQQLTAIDTWFEGKIAWTVSQSLPPETPLFIANSTPVRDVEWFWKPGDRHIQPFFNRGANGIDGTLSTALGVAHRNQSSVLLTGDLAFLHDTNGLLATRICHGHLTVIVINNNGGGIFEFLPIAQFEPPFEDYFATPQHIDLNTLCHAYGVEYEMMESWAMLEDRLTQLPDSGVRVLEIQCDRRYSFQQRQQLWSSVTSIIS